jgi:threonyl-tRNA synthetase
VIDHRKLGRELGIFHSVPEVGAGLPIWLPDGAAARHAIEEYVRELERRNGYRHVYSPPLAKREVYERSGHLAHFGEEMFPPMDGLYLRPSLCPHHAMVFASRGRSHRELPLRIGELGPMYREERSGVLGGLHRVRAVSLNDAHIFCAEEQVVDEVREVLRLIGIAHAALGVEAHRFRLSLPAEPGSAEPGSAEPDPAGPDPGGGRAAELLRAALVAAGVSYQEAPGEAAFYGPKIDVQILDPAGRESTLSTVQVDFHQPERFGLSYVDAGGARRRPVMVHRSLVGSMERLMAYLLERHDGALPAWCAPVQVAVLPIADNHPDERAAAQRFAADSVRAGLRAEVWYDGSLGVRVREAAARRVPHVAVVGRREAEQGEVSVRSRGGSASVVLPAPEALAFLVGGCAPPG